MSPPEDESQAFRTPMDSGNHFTPRSEEVVVIINGQAWTVGEPINRGGYGRVFQAHSPDNESAAIKFVRKEPGAERELLIARDLGSHPNIVPVQGIGQHDDNWLLLMPLARGSLRDVMSQMEDASVVKVIEDIAQGLQALHGQGIVHRDLKPENVLLMKHAWAISDFGVARYIEAAVGTSTRRRAITPAYGAPEQWRGEKVTGAADIYALGHLGYELLSARPAFTGPDWEYQHLNVTPKPLTKADPRLRVIVEKAISKSAATRPSATEILTELRRPARPAQGRGIGALSQANDAVDNAISSARRAKLEKREMAAAEARYEKLRRRQQIDLLRVASISYEEIGSQLANAIKEAAPHVQLEGGKKKNWKICFQKGELEFSDCSLARRSGLPFDCAAIGHIGLPYRNGKLGRHHSLWYCNADGGDTLSWFEVAFMDRDYHHMSFQHRSSPFSLRPDQAVSAFTEYVPESRWNIATREARGLPRPDHYAIAWPFLSLRGAGLSLFIDRWSGWLAFAAKNGVAPASGAVSGAVPSEPGGWRAGRIPGLNELLY